MKNRFPCLGVGGVCKTVLVSRLSKQANRQTGLMVDGCKVLKVPRLSKQTGRQDWRRLWPHYNLVVRLKKRYTDRERDQKVDCRSILINLSKLTVILSELGEGGNLDSRLYHSRTAGMKIP